MPSTYTSQTFLDFRGSRINRTESVAPSLSEARARHDTVANERDEVLRALIDSQNKLKAMLNLLEIQTRLLTQYGAEFEQEVTQEWLGYRWFVKDTTTYIPDIGFYSRGRPDGRNQNQIWIKDMVVGHIKGYHTRPASNYLSVSDSPGRVLSSSVIANASDYEVAVIDLSKLQELGQPLRRTTDLNKELLVTEHVDYATFSHILVYASIPPFCILGFVSKTEFEDVCQRKGILAGSSTCVDYDLKLRRQDLSLRPEARFEQPLYHNLPRAPPPINCKVRLNPSRSKKMLDTGELPSKRTIDVIGDSACNMAGLSID